MSRPSKRPASLEEIKKFIERHALTTFDQFSDFPDPIYRVIWEGEEYIERDQRTLANKIHAEELKKLPVWFPQRPVEAL